MALQKKLHDKLVPFKIEVGSLLEKIGKTNMQEVTGLSNEVQQTESSVREAEEKIRSQDKQIQ